MTAFRLRSLVCLAGALALGAQEPEVRSFGQQQDVYPSSRDAAPRRENRPQPKPQPQPQQQPQEEDMRSEAPALDKHYLQASEYLITLKEYKAGSHYETVYIARMVTPASSQTKGEAEFFVINSHKKGEKVWTKYFAKTRPATKADLQLGTLAYALDGNSPEGIYSGPKKREDNIDHTWFLGTINDDSELYKGYLMLSGYKVRPGALRVVTQ